MKGARLKICAAAVIAAAVMLGLEAGCSKPRPEARGPNIVLVLVDALRKDHVGAYGYERDTTPNIDRLAQDGLLFENAVSQAPWTLPSMASVFTSMYPSQVIRSDRPDLIKENARLGREKYFMLSDEAVTLAEALAGGGYHTMSVTISEFTSSRFNMAQGIKDETILDSSENADRVFGEAEQAIERHTGAGRPFFLFLHLIDVHEPTDPPPPYDTMYPTIDGRPHTERHKRWAYKTAEKLDTPGFLVYRSHKTALYDGAISYVDDRLGRFTEYLKGKGLYDNTVFVIMADHGEELWDHAGFEKERYFPGDAGYYGMGHGHTMFREILDVPLVISGDGVQKGRVKQQVRCIDITPTLLGIAGIDTKGQGFEGTDLIDSLRKNELKDLVALSESPDVKFDMKAVQDARYKYIRIEDREFLFDKLEDPGERKDISKENAEKAGEMSALMDKMSGGLRKLSEGGQVEMNEETKRKLKALGYLQ